MRPVIIATPWPRAGATITENAVAGMARNDLHRHGCLLHTTQACGTSGDRVALATVVALLILQRSPDASPRAGERAGPSEQPREAGLP
ncbi:MAG: hypothetical protein RL033_3763 [Pseudomonadota bacterium]|jgi:hypothetical protein